MRKYESIWQRLKAHPKHEIRVEVHKALVRRIVKAVTKEKYIDLGFKLLNEDDYLFLEIEKEAKNDNIIIVKFILKRRLGLEDIKV